MEQEIIDYLKETLVDYYNCPKERELLDSFAKDIIAKLKSIGYEQVWKECPECYGQGQITGADLGVPTNATAYFCDNCNGTGRVRRLFELPEGIEEKIAKHICAFGDNTPDDFNKMDSIAKGYWLWESEQILSLIRQYKE